MPIAEYQLVEFGRAYRILGVPVSASASSIKHAYRRIAKRWHPDLYRCGTPAYAEATDMMKRINEAYSLIEHAPLRYHIESHPLSQERKRQTGAQSQSSLFPDWPVRTQQDPLPMTDRVEFWVRFVCGVVFGAFASFNLVSNLSTRPTPGYLAVLLTGIVVLVLSCGFAAARYGNRFWLRIL